MPVQGTRRVRRPTRSSVPRRVRAVDSQNHYYGHSAAFAAYLGMPRPRHIAGLVQHGWTAVSPLETHFRDFPAVGTAARPGRRLLVWSHRSRAWDPAAESRVSVPIGAAWHYLCRTIGDVAPGSGTVIMPVHGIATQAVRGDHRTVARVWAEVEGASTVCLYHVEAGDPAIVDAYLSAGHHVVTLGTRTDPAFLGRLHSLITGAARVVSNRLSTPIVYAASVGVETAVTGDPMRLEGEDGTGVERLRSLWPEFYDPAVDPGVRAAAAAETGADFVREPDELRGLLGWDHRSAGPWLDHWVTAPSNRALATIRRRSTAAPDTAASEGGALGLAAWLRAAAGYLPQGLGRVPEGRPRPIEIAVGLG